MMTNSIFQIPIAPAGQSQAGTPGGSDTQVQFNDSSSFGGSSKFTFNKTTGALALQGQISCTLGISGTNTLSAATGDEIGFDFYTAVNKLTSGNYYGVRISAYEASAPGTLNRLLSLGTKNVNGAYTEKASILSDGRGYFGSRVQSADNYIIGMDAASGAFYMLSDGITLGFYGRAYDQAKPSFLFRTQAGIGKNHSNSSGVAGEVEIYSAINQSGTAGFHTLRLSRYDQALGSGAQRFLSFGTYATDDPTGTFTELAFVDNAGKGTFADLTSTGLTASQAVMTDANKKLVSADYLDQAVKQASSPTFAAVRSKQEVFTAAAANDARFVTLVDMKVGTYSIANAAPGDGLAHNLIVTHATQGGTADTLGTLDVVGLDAEGGAQTETITPSADGTVLSTKYWSSITSITGVGWVIDAGGTPDADHIKIGFSTKIMAAVVQCKGSLIRLSQANTVLLPAIAIGYSLLVYSTAANAIVVTPNASDRIILDGAAGGDGKKITSASAAGDFVSLLGDTADGWTVLGRSGTWTMES